MDFEELPDDDLLAMFQTTDQQLNDPVTPAYNRLLAAQLGEMGYALHARGINPDE